MSPVEFEKRPCPPLNSRVKGLRTARTDSRESLRDRGAARPLVPELVPESRVQRVQSVVGRPAGPSHTMR